MSYEFEFEYEVALNFVGWIIGFELSEYEYWL